MAAVVDDRSLRGDRYFVVDDVLVTLAALANCHRRGIKVPVIAVTGSNDNHQGAYYNSPFQEK